MSLEEHQKFMERLIEFLHKDGVSSERALGAMSSLICRMCSTSTEPVETFHIVLQEMHKWFYQDLAQRGDFPDDQQPSH